MSDTSQGPGWWLASDGKWYPPEQWTGPPNTSPPTTGPPSGPTDAPSEPWTPGQSSAQPGSTVQPGQPGSTWQTGAAGVPGQPPAYGAAPWPASAPAAQPGYGATPYGQPVYVAPGGASTNGLAIASFVCSIVGFFFITFIVAIVLGFVARSQIKNSGGRQKGDGFAIAGIIIGFAWVAFYVLLIIVGAVTNNTNSSVISLVAAIGHIA
jgi:hypothetical protein